MKRAAAVLAFLCCGLAFGQTVTEDALRTRARSYTGLQSFDLLGAPRCKPDPPANPCQPKTMCFSHNPAQIWYCVNGSWTVFGQGVATVTLAVAADDTEVLFTDIDAPKGASALTYNKTTETTKIQSDPGAASTFGTGCGASVGSDLCEPPYARFVVRKDATTTPVFSVAPLDGSDPYQVVLRVGRRAQDTGDSMTLGYFSEDYADLRDEPCSFCEAQAVYGISTYHNNGINDDVQLGVHGNARSVPNTTADRIGAVIGVQGWSSHLGAGETSNIIGVAAHGEAKGHGWDANENAETHLDSHVDNVWGVTAAALASNMPNPGSGPLAAENYGVNVVIGAKADVDAITSDINSAVGFQSVVDVTSSSTANSIFGFTSDVDCADSTVTRMYGGLFPEPINGSGCTPTYKAALALGKASSLDRAHIAADNSGEEGAFGYDFPSDYWFISRAGPAILRLEDTTFPTTWSVRTSAISGNLFLRDEDSLDNVIQVGKSQSAASEDPDGSIGVNVAPSTTAYELWVKRPASSSKSTSMVRIERANGQGAALEFYDNYGTTGLGQIAYNDVDGMTFVKDNTTFLAKLTPTGNFKPQEINGVLQVNMIPGVTGAGSAGSQWAGWESSALAAIVAGKAVHFPTGTYTTTGFDVTSASAVQYARITGDGPQKTIIKCEGSDRCFNFDNDFSGRITMSGIRWYLDATLTTGRCAYNDLTTCTTDANCISGSTSYGECIKAFIDIGNQQPNCETSHLACSNPGTTTGCSGQNCKTTNRSGDFTVRDVELIAKDATVSAGVTALKITNANHGIIDNVLVSADADVAGWKRGADLMPCEDYNRGNIVVTQSTFGAIATNGIRVAFCDANIGGTGGLVGNVVNDVNFVGTKVVGGGYGASPPAGTVGFDLYHQALNTTFTGTHSEAFQKGVQLNEGPDGTSINGMMFGHMASSTNPDGFGVYVQYGVCQNVSGKSRQWCASVADCTYGGATCIGQVTDNLSIRNSTFADWSPGSAGGACYYCSTERDTRCSVDADCSTHGGGTCESGCGTALLLPAAGTGHASITTENNYYYNIRDKVLVDAHCSTTTATDCDQDTDCPATEWCKSSSGTTYANTKLEGVGSLRLTRDALNEQTDSMLTLDSLSAARPGISMIDNNGTAQDWFVGANDGGFVINDSTGTATRAVTILPTDNTALSNKVGINTASPAYELHVVRPASSGTSGTLARFERDNGDSVQVELYDGFAPTLSATLSADATNGLQFGINGTTKAKLDTSDRLLSAGLVGVGSVTLTAATCLGAVGDRLFQDIDCSGAINGSDSYVAFGDSSGNATGLACSGCVDLASEVSGDLPFSNIAQIATDRLVGRDTSGTGDVEQLTVGGGVEFTGSGGIQRSALTGDTTATAGSNATTTVQASTTWARPGDISATVSADTNDWSPSGLSSASVIRATMSGGSYNLTGLTGGADGRIVTIQNVGTTLDFTLIDDSVSSATNSSASNRMELGTSIVLGPAMAATLQYDSTSSRWRQIARGGQVRVVEQFFKVGAQFNSVNSNDWDSLTYLPTASTISMGGDWPAFFLYNTPVNAKKVWSTEWMLPDNADMNQPIDVDLVLKVPDESSKQSLWTVTLGCIHVTDDYETSFSTNANSGSSQYVQSQSGGYMFRTVAFNNLDKQYCLAGDLLGIMVKRKQDATDTAGTVSFWGARLRYRVIE